MRVDVRPRHRNAGRPPEKDARGFTQWLKGRPCVFADDGTCDGKIVPAHLDWAGGKGTSTKVADRYCIPMCNGFTGHHARQHGTGWDTFMRDMGVSREDLMVAAARLWNAWPARAAWERSQA